MKKFFIRFFVFVAFSFWFVSCEHPSGVEDFINYKKPTTTTSSTNNGSSSYEIKFLDEAAPEGFISTASWTYPSSHPTTTWTGSGTYSSPYIITTAQQLADLSKLVALGYSQSGKYFKLANNIHLNSGRNVKTKSSTSFKSWVPIGYSKTEDKSKVFSGIFDGDYYCILGLYINDSSYPDTALFAYVGETAQIKNLLVDGYINNQYNCKSSLTQSRTGAFAARNDGVFYQCESRATVYTKTDGRASSYIGGFVGSNYGTINGCSNSGYVIADHTSTHGTYIPVAGGFAGIAYDDAYLYSLENYADVSGYYAGGILGLKAKGANVVMTSNKNYGALAGKTTGSEFAAVAPK